MTYGRVIRFESEIPQSAHAVTRRSTGLSGPEWMRRRCHAGETCIASPEAIVRTELEQRLGGYREDLPHSADMEMWMRFTVHGLLGYVDGVQASFGNTRGACDISDSCRLWIGFGNEGLRSRQSLRIQEILRARWIICARPRTTLSREKLCGQCFS